MSGINTGSLCGLVASFVNAKYYILANIQNDTAHFKAV